MEPDQFALAEKIIKDLNHIVNGNFNINAFEIIPVDGNTMNQSPILVNDDSLGLESWCVEHMFTYCFSEIKENFLMKPYRKLSKITSADAERLVNLLNVILLLNPELSTLWNQRREMYLRGAMIKSSELHYTMLVLTWKSKCNDVYAYRRWLVDHHIDDPNVRHSFESHVFSELGICDIAAGKSPNNYHCWSHRLWFMNRIRKATFPQLLATLFVREYDSTEKWIAKNISDCSCYHYRQFCIKNLLTVTTPDKWTLFEHTLGLQNRIFVEFIYANLPKSIEFVVDKAKVHECPVDDLLKLVFGPPVKNCTCIFKIGFGCKKLDLLYRELFLNNESIRFYTQHETLWYHRRFIIHEILIIMYDYFGLARIDGSLIKVGCKGCLADIPKKPKVVKYEDSDISKSKAFCALLAHEKKFIKDRKADCDRILAEKHYRYLNVVEGLTGLK